MGSEVSTDASSAQKIGGKEEFKELQEEVTAEEIKEYFGTDFAVNVSSQVFALREEITNIRRFFHSHPELSFEEKATGRSVARYLEKLDMDVKTNVGGFGVVATLNGSNPGPCIMLRADMDALPVQETADVPYASKKEGVMHACGHDCHMAILLGAARVLSSLREHLYGTVKFVFQPAEERGAGAQKMIEEGVLESPHVDQVYGLHVWSFQKFGTVVCRDGPQMAGSARIAMTVTGKGGHGAVPQHANDCVVAASHLVTQLHSIVARNVPPMDAAVLTIGKVAAGTAGNVIPEEASVEGTIRWLNRETHDLLLARVEQVCRGIERSFGVKVALSVTNSAPCTVNHRKGSRNVLAAVRQVLPQGILDEVPPAMVAEDFSFFLQQRMGAFFFLGCGVEGNEVFAHHKSDFRVDERCLVVGSQIFVTLILELLCPPRGATFEESAGSGIPNEKETETVIEDAPLGSDTASAQTANQ